MLHNKRHRPPARWGKYKRSDLPWKGKMTLCIAAGCVRKSGPCIVASADLRVETDFAGSDTAFKYEDLSPGWIGLMAGDDLSNALELAATFRSTIDPFDLDRDNIFDKLNEVSCAHHKKLVSRLIQMKLGVSLERFYAQGDDGIVLTPEDRSRLQYQIEQVNFGCSMISCGFLPAKPLPYIFSFDIEGNVSQDQSFAAIGTGSIVAEASLFQRGQGWLTPFDETLYNVYEASKMASEANAPGVGSNSFLFIARPNIEFNEAFLSVVTHEDKLALEKCFVKFGPKPVKINALPKITLEEISGD